MKGKPEKTLGEVLKEFVKSAPWSRRGELGELDRAWHEAAGELLSRRSRIVGLSGGTLTVHVESSAVRHEIEAFRKAEILARIGEIYPRKRIAALRCVLRS